VAKVLAGLGGIGAVELELEMEKSTGALENNYCILSALAATIPLSQSHLTERDTKNTSSAADLSRLPGYTKAPLGHRSSETYIRDHGPLQKAAATLQMATRHDVGTDSVHTSRCLCSTRACVYGK
jgi:hypothetical protein